MGQIYFCVISQTREGLPFKPTFKNPIEDEEVVIDRYYMAVLDKRLKIYSVIEIPKEDSYLLHNKDFYLTNSSELKRISFYEKASAKVITLLKSIEDREKDYLLFSYKSRPEEILMKRKTEMKKIKGILDFVTRVWWEGI